MRRRLLLLVAAVAATAGGCADEEADEGAAVEAMVLETCAPGGDPAADPVCRCAYEALLDRFGAEALARFDLQLRSDPGALPEEAERIILDCAFERVDPRRPTTTSPAPSTTSDADGTTTTEAG